MLYSHLSRRSTPWPLILGLRKSSQEDRHKESYADLESNHFLDLWMPCPKGQFGHSRTKAGNPVMHGTPGQEPFSFGSENDTLPQFHFLLLLSIQAKLISPLVSPQLYQHFTQSYPFQNIHYYSPLLVLIINDKFLSLGIYKEANNF